MSALVLDDVIKSVRDLPSLPMIVTQLIDSFEQEDASIGEVAQSVSRDQALAAKTLRIANSSFYGLQHKVTTIPQAITVLGFDSIRALIVSAGIIDNFSNISHDRFDFRMFWRHAIATALSAKSLARALKLNQDHAFVSGLLHDIGQLVLVTRFPQLYGGALSHQVAKDCYLLDAERVVLGVDHTVVGQALAEYWKFPPSIQRAIGNHHAPRAQDMGGIPSVVHIANAIAHALDLAGDEHEAVPPISEFAWNSLTITPTVLNTVFKETESEFEEACQILHE